MNLRNVKSWLMVVACVCATIARGEELRVFAAASLLDVLGEVAPLYSKATGNTVVFNFGGSGALARQIKEGASADVVFSADEMRIDQLEQAGLLLADSRRNIVGNTLVVVVAVDQRSAVSNLADLNQSGIRRVAIGEPAIVPAGTYAKDCLERLGLWASIGPKCIPLDNVRAVLSAVESGNADAGFVYRTDALGSKKVRVAVEVPRGEGPRIVYPAAVIKSSRSPESARALISYLVGSEAQAVFAKHGFLAPN